MGSVVIYGLYKSVVLWQTNSFLFAVSVFITICTLAGAMLQSIGADGLKFKWMLWYIIPAGLLVIGGVIQNTELSDSIMSTAGISPPPHVIPGTSQDYKDAATGQYISMVFPFFAWAFSKLVLSAIDCFSNKKNA